VAVNIVARGLNHVIATLCNLIVIWPELTVMLRDENIASHVSYITVRISNVMRTLCHVLVTSNRMKTLCQVSYIVSNKVKTLCRVLVTLYQIK
jgi:hypothetical protein